MTLALSPPQTGACHCEAGLMASLLLHSRLAKDVPTDLEEAEKGEAVGLPELAIFTNVFGTEASFYTVSHLFLTSFVQDITGKHTIGVAKKSCPLCRMLSEILKEKYGLEVTLPGQHTMFFPWVPPYLATHRCPPGNGAPSPTGATRNG
jgi:hypothetical protein